MNKVLGRMTVKKGEIHEIYREKLSTKYYGFVL